MKMTKVDIKKYPKLAYYVKMNLPMVIHEQSIVSAMKKIGNINTAGLQNALTWGQGPQIKVTRLVNAVGEFSPGINSSELRIDSNMVKDFEEGRGRRVARAGNVYLLGVTLLHELVHWGDDQNGIDRLGEEGSEFESLVYGSVIN